MHVYGRTQTAQCFLISCAERFLEFIFSLIFLHSPAVGKAHVCSSEPFRVRPAPRCQAGGRVTLGAWGGRRPPWEAAPGGENKFILRTEMYVEWVPLEAHGRSSKLIFLYMKFMGRNDPSCRGCFKPTSSLGRGAGPGSPRPLSASVPPSVTTCNHGRAPFQSVACRRADTVPHSSSCPV